MEGDINYRQILTKAMAVCSRSERCRFDVVEKLRQWELPEDEIAPAIDYLIKERFLDEERFVRFYVNDKLRFNKWGKVKLSFMLRQKQISENIIREAFSQIDNDLYLKTLRSLLASKIKSIKGSSDYERKGKLAVFAQSHGFESELAYQIAAEMIGNDTISEAEADQ
jgi:regulatory protein